VARYAASMTTRKVFITGSADGLGKMAGERLLVDGHAVVLHARSEARAAAVRKAVPGAEAVVVGDVGTLAAMKSVAERANHHGPYDAVIHNVAIGYQEPRRVETADGLEMVFAVNVLASYVLTALIPRPERLIYLTSGLHRSGDPSLHDPQWKSRRWNGTQAYSDSKLFDVILAFAVARRWTGTFSNSVEPGWVATKMGGPGAPDDLALGSLTQAWLAGSADEQARVTAANFYHQQTRDPHPATRETRVQDELLAYCASVSGVALP
jgi:NAD(P)-dependent dehydrogenase (short-subunit alcohol dehydrogenase family)